MPIPISCRIRGRCRARSRAVTGWGPRDYWFPNIRSLPGAALMLICVYYPYVYLLARTAFGQQSATAYLAARTLGRGPWGAFFRVSLPIARPAIAAGVLLAIMETIADYGTVAYFNVRTFSTGIYQAWFNMQDRAAAAQLALCLLAFALMLAGVERLQRGAGAVAHARRPADRDAAAAARRAGAAGWRPASARCRWCWASCCRRCCWPPWRSGSGQTILDPRYRGFVGHSLLLAGRRGGGDGGGRGAGRLSRPAAAAARRGSCWSAPGSATRCRGG